MEFKLEKPPQGTDSIYVNNDTEWTNIHSLHQKALLVFKNLNLTMSLQMHLR